MQRATNTFFPTVQRSSATSIFQTHQAQHCRALSGLESLVLLADEVGRRHLHIVQLHVGGATGPNTCETILRGRWGKEKNHAEKKQIHWQKE